MSLLVCGLRTGHPARGWSHVSFPMVTGVKKIELITTFPHTGHMCLEGQTYIPILRIHISFAR